MGFVRERERGRSTWQDSSITSWIQKEDEEGEELVQHKGEKTRKGRGLRQPAITRTLMPFYWLARFCGQKTIDL